MPNLLAKAATPAVGALVLLAALAPGAEAASAASVCAYAAGVDNGPVACEVSVSGTCLSATGCHATASCTVRVQHGVGLVGCGDCRDGLNHCASTWSLGFTIPSGETFSATLSCPVQAYVSTGPLEATCTLAVA